MNPALDGQIARVNCLFQIARFNARRESRLFDPGIVALQQPTLARLFDKPLQDHGGGRTGMRQVHELALELNLLDIQSRRLDVDRPF